MNFTDKSEIHWYKLKIRNQKLMEGAKEKLADSSIEYICFQDEFYPGSNLARLSYRFGLIIYVRTDIDTISAFLKQEKESKIFKLFKDTHSVPLIFDDKTVEQTQRLFREYNGEFILVNEMPPVSKKKLQDEEQMDTINYLNICELTGILKKMQKAQIDKFYISLLEDIKLFIPVPKNVEIVSDKQINKERIDCVKNRWMILRTHHEELWYKKLDSWNENMKSTIEKDASISTCHVFLPRRSHIDRNGREHMKLLCHGYLFLRTSIDNLRNIETELDYGIPSIRNAVMTVPHDYEALNNKNTTKKGERATIDLALKEINPVVVDESTMMNFMFVTSLESGELEYDVFDYILDEYVVYINRDSPFYNRVGSLSRKGDDFYIVFCPSNKCGNLELPAVKVPLHQVRKLSEEEIREFKDKSDK